MGQLIDSNITTVEITNNPSNNIESSSLSSHLFGAQIKAKNEFGKVKMDGIISNDKLVLTVVNIEENTARDFVFEFYPLPVKQ